MMKIFSLIFIWAARLPAVAVGLSALLRFARAAPIPAATEPRGGVGIFHSATGYGQPPGRTPCVPTKILSRNQRNSRSSPNFYQQFTNRFSTQVVQWKKQLKEQSAEIFYILQILFINN